MNRILTIIGYGSLAVLFILELTLRYDTWTRQIALSITNVISVVILICITRSFHRRGAALPWIVVWSVSLGVWFDAAGNFANLYARILWWDKLAHAVGSAAASLGLWEYFGVLIKSRIIVISKSLRVLIVVSITALLSALYEITEYVGDTLFPTHRVTDLYDTADDLWWNLVGAFVAIAIALAVRKIQNENRRPIKAAAGAGT